MKSIVIIVIFTAYLLNNMGIQCQHYQGYCFDLDCQKIKIKNSIGALTDEFIRQYSKINHFELEVEKFPHIPFALEDPYQFRPPHASQVSLLNINIPLIIFSSTLLRNTARLKETKNEIFNDPNLLELEICNASFNLRHHSWKLSHSLNRLNFSGNKYTSYDLTNYNDLTDLDFENNWLIGIPTLSRHSMPLLKKLNFLRNPLYDFTVNGIAGLCDLEELKLSYYSMGSGHRSCKCRRIKKWIEKLKRDDDHFIFEGEFKCADVSADKCTEYTLDEAQRLRDRCLLGNDWDTDMEGRSSNNRIVAVFEFNRRSYCTGSCSFDCFVCCWGLLSLC